MTKVSKKEKNLKDDPIEAPSDDPVETLTDQQLIAAKFLARACFAKGSGRRTGAAKGAAQKVGVHENTIQNWLKKPAFLEALDSYKEMLDDAAFEGLEQLLRGGPGVSPNITAIIWHLKNRMPELFDEQLRRDKIKQAHDERMLKLKLEAGQDPDADQELPDIVFRETGPNERIEAGPDGEGH